MSVNSLANTTFQNLEGNALEHSLLSSGYFSTQRLDRPAAISIHQPMRVGTSGFSCCSCLADPNLDSSQPSAQPSRPLPPVTNSGISVADSPPTSSSAISGVDNSGSSSSLVTGTKFSTDNVLYAPNPITISHLAFSFQEGATGTLQIQLNQVPTAAVTLTLTGGAFVVVDADGDPRNGTQTSITITPETWQQARTIWFIAEDDNVSADRTVGNTISYSFSGGLTLNGTYDLGTIANTYAPDPTRFNIDLDFRNDAAGFWTAERQAIAQKAANDWADWIADRWSGFQLNNAIELLDNGFPSQSTFTTKRYVDDVLVFVNSINSGGLVGGYGGPEYQFGGWATSNGSGSMPRVGQIAIDTSISDTYLYNAVLHELGHVLGLVGMDWAGYLQEDLSTPQTATFKGYYATAANGGNPVPLQSQDGPNSVTGTYNYYHPASQVVSVMSYSWLYSVTGPTAIDYAMLADSGYHVYGINDA